MGDDGHVRFFLSCVTDEFGAYRELLRHALTRHNVEVKVQEDFIDFGTPTLDKLDRYIAHCDAVIHLAGDMTGSFASPRSAELLLASHPHIPARLEPLAQALGAGEAISYTQWEAWLALVHGKPLLIAKPDPSAQRGPRFAPTDASRDSQAGHLDRLRAFDLYPGVVFSSGDDLAKQLLATAVLDLMARARSAPATPRAVMLPYPALGPLLKGRDEHLARLAAAFGAPPTKAAPGLAAKALYGLGGIGKTRLAIEYGHRRAADYNAVLFVSAEDPHRLDAELAQLAGPRVLDLPTRDAPEEEIRVSSVIAWLGANPGWLLIVDNVDSEEAAVAVEDLIARLNGGHVLINGRIATYGAGIEMLELGELPIADAAAFLLERTQGKRSATAADAEQAQAIAEALGGLALALEQAGAYIARDRISLARYLELWRNTRDRLLDWHHPRLMAYRHSIAVTWAASVGRLPDAARRLLDRVSWLAPDPIPETLLDALPGDDADGHDALSGLYDQSLATPVALRPEASSAGGPAFAVHRLVQEVDRRAQAAPDDSALPDALAMICATFTDDPLEVGNWPRLDMLAPHARAVAGFAEEAGTGAVQAASLLNRCATLSHAKGSYKDAEALFRRGLALVECVPDANDVEIARHLNDLAWHCRETGGLAEAEDLYRRALVLREARFGAASREVAVSLSGLGGTQRDRGDPEAEENLRRAEAILTALAVPDDRDLAECISRLAGLLRTRGLSDAAEPLLRRALAIRQSAYGADHTQTATSLNNLALLLQDTERPEEAETLFRQALAIYERAYGQEHPHVATCLDNVASVLLVTGRYEEAEQASREALRIKEARHGEGHALVAVGLNTLAALLAMTGREEEAEPLSRRALRIFEDSYDADHLHVAVGLGTLAPILEALGRPEEAEEAYVRALRICVATLDPGHHWIGDLRESYEALLRRSGRTESEIAGLVVQASSPEAAATAGSGPAS